MKLLLKKYLLGNHYLLRIFTRCLFLFYCFIINFFILSLASCENSNLITVVNEHGTKFVYSPSMPHFDAIDNNGTKTRFDSSSEGLIILISNLNNQSDVELTVDQVNSFSRINDLDIVTVTSRTVSESKPNLLTASQDTLDRIFNLYEIQNQDIFALCFKDGQYSGALSTDPNSNSLLDIKQIQIGLYRGVLGYESLQAVIESKDPSLYINFQKFQNLHSDFLANHNMLYIFLVGNTNLSCAVNNRNILKEFDVLAHSIKGNKAIIVFADGTLMKNIPIVKDNFEIKSECIVADENILREFHALKGINLDARYNILAVIQENDEMEINYVHDCESLQNLLYLSRK